MAKGFGKFLAFCTVVGAAAAGAYYYMNRRDKALADEFDDDFDDFSDFDDVDDAEPRGYVNLDHEAEEATPEKKEAADADGEESAVETEDFFDDTEKE